MDGRTVVVTGGSSGVGYFTAERLAGLGARVVIAARDVDRTDRACRSIGAQVPGADVRAELLDLSSLGSVRAAASRLAALGRIDALVANGAVVALPDHVKPRDQRGHRRQVTRDGIELHWGTNYLGHFALIASLLPVLLESRARIVQVGSLGHAYAREPAGSLPLPDDPQSDIAKYARSKLAVMSLGFELARRFTANGCSASSIVAHPGTAVDSLSPTRDVATNQPEVRPALRPLLRVVLHGKHAGAEPIVTAVASPSARNGDYWGPGGWRQLRGVPARHRPHANSLDPVEAERLVSLSEELTGLRLGLETVP